jgi:citronellol/citronellal dehydrogenase
MGKLDGKNIVVTGASRGIGAEIARLFAAEGGHVVCAARTVQEGDHPLEGSLESTVAGIRGNGGEATAFAANISELEECEKLISGARDIYGPVDILINNAALTYFLPVKDFAINRWLRSWSVNFQAIFFLSKLVLDDMISRGSGSIVSISSGSAIGPGRGPYKTGTKGFEEGLRGSSCYGAEKAALERFTQGLASEVYQYGVSVSCVAPSLVVPTPGTIFHNLVSGNDDPNGEPAEYLAKASLILASEPMDSVTGRVTYSQLLLEEYGLLKNPRGIGIDPDRPGTGYSQR